MEQFTRECLEIDTESERDPTQAGIQSGSMDKIYDRAVRLVKRTLDVEGVLVLDVSHADVADVLPPQDFAPTGHMSIVVHSAEPSMPTATKALSVAEYTKINQFFYKNPDGKVVEGLVPSAFRGMIPPNIKYALSKRSLRARRCAVSHIPSAVVPVFDVDKRPFALLCAYNSTQGEKPFVRPPTCKETRQECLIRVADSSKAMSCRTCARSVSSARARVRGKC